MSKILLTSALPYANGSIHIGHLVEYVQSDIFARYHRSIGTNIIHLCADDTHGTPIEMNAARQGISPDELVARTFEEHTRDLTRFSVAFDLFYTTNSPENRELAGLVYTRLRDAGHIVRESRSQFYSEKLQRFLSDRMIKGTCPRCGAENQYGDVCEVCGATYTPGDLIDPRDAITGETPVLKESENLYVKLTDFVPMLQEWISAAVPQESIQNFVVGWLDRGLENWCISREAPYFGFEIPGEPGKYFYVWLDAPIGYIATTRKYCEDRGLNWLEYWGPDADAKIIHNIGKDIVYFHTLFWPAMLHAAKLKKPDLVHVHGMLTVNQKKMSKSRGTFIKASTFAEFLDPDYLRFYYAVKLNDGLEDIDLSLEDFVTRVNADLINNVVNFCSRVTKFIDKRFSGEVSEFDPNEFPICEIISNAQPAIHDAYANWEFRDAVRAVIEVGNAVNLFFQSSAPWTVIQTDEALARRICAVGLYAANFMITALSPVTPGLATRYAAQFGMEQLGWKHAVPSFRPNRVVAADKLLERVDPVAVQAVVDASVIPDPNAAKVPDVPVELVKEFSQEITIDDFSKVDLRVGIVVSATAVPDAEKLLQLKVNCGREINVFAGVRKAYPDPSVLVGRRVLVLANLKPRKMRFGVSEGMLLATSGADDVGLQLVFPDDTTKAGWTVR